MSIERALEAVRNDLTTTFNLDVPEPGQLFKAEYFWRDHYNWLKSAGYQLRRRYEPDWTPSWGGTKLRWDKCEDGQACLHAHVLDATRLKDNTIVMLKIVYKSVHPYEAQIQKYFTERSEERNHCAPLYDVLDVPTDPDKSILVMPLLRRWDDPPFETWRDAIHFFQDIIFGLAYMHEHNVAHRDINSTNIMMDPTGLYPGQFHPVRTDLDREFRRPVIHASRSQKRPRYLYVDFGLSRQYRQEDLPLDEPIIYGGDKSPPEHKPPAVSCDPFPTDVYYLGNFLRENFVRRKRGFSFMRDLAEDMCHNDPTKRPGMKIVEERFIHICSQLDEWKLSSRLADRDENLVLTVVRGTPHVMGQFSSLIRNKLFG